MDKISTRQWGKGERRLSEYTVSATQSLREERDRLAQRLADLERELANLAARLDTPSAFAMSGGPERRRL